MTRYAQILKHMLSSDNKLTEQQIKNIQEVLYCTQTGELDMLTQAAINNWMLRNPESRSVTNWNSLYDMIVPLDLHNNNLNTTKDEFLDANLDADLNINHIMKDSINQHFLNPNCYVTNLGKMPEERKWLFLHHTAGWDNPFDTVNFWNNDSRGKIGTHFVIGGTNIRNNNSQFNGTIVQCIPYEYFAWHLGIGNTQMHRESIGIELCNFGYLEHRNYTFYTIYGHKVMDERQVIELDVPFRGQKYWHKYSEEQIESLYTLIKLCEAKFNLNIKEGLPSLLKTLEVNSAFEYSNSIRQGNNPGIYSHTNVIQSGKWDVSPQPLLIEMLKSL